MLARGLVGLHLRCRLQAGVAQRKSRPDVEKPMVKMIVMSYSNTNMPNEDSAVEVWRQKIEFLEREKAISADADQKFQLQKNIDDAREQIKNLEMRGAGGGGRSASRESRRSTAVGAAMALLALAGIGTVLGFWVFPAEGRTISRSSGAWIIAAFAVVIFFWLMAAVIEKSRPGRFDGEQTYRFFRLAMVLPFILAVVGLIAPLVKESFDGREPARAERVQNLTLELKSEDPTRRRLAVEGLVPYGEEAATEIVKAISEEAGVVASEMLGRAASLNWGDLFSELLGMPAWKTPFMDAATTCLVQIGEPAVSPILGQLAAESVVAEQFLAAAAERQAPENPGLAEALGQFGSLFGAAGQGMRTQITREMLARGLTAIGEPAVPELLDALESPRLLVQATSYQVLIQIPSAREPTLQKLREMADRANSDSEREQLLKAIQALEARAD